MAVSQDEFRYKLLDKIQFAGSQAEVMRFCTATFGELMQHNGSHQIAAAFVDKVIRDLDSFNPMDKDAREWSNIKTARVIFRRIRLDLTTSAR